MERLTVAAVVSVLKSIIAVISVFMVSIVVHEFGHYIVAKRFGVAVPAFAIGFGPKLVRWLHRGTEFSIRLFLLGGLVQLAGEVPQDALFRKGEVLAVKLNDEGRVTVLGDPADVPDGLVGKLHDHDLTHRMQVTLDFGDELKTFRLVPHAKLMTNARSSIPLVERHEQVLGKPPWQRAAMILAGPLMNFILAGLLFTAVFAHNGVPVDRPELGAIVTGSRAAQAGLLEGDRVLAVDGAPVQSWQAFVQRIRADRTLAPLTLDIVRDGQPLRITVTPKWSSVDQAPQLGINPPLTHDLVHATGNGFAFMYYASLNTLQLYGQVIAHREFNSLAGPVGIAGVISQGAQSGLWQVVMIAALLNLNLGLFNLLPVPALDGGRLVFMVVEMVRGKSVDPRKEGLVHFVGFALLMLFAAIITCRDVTRLF